MSNPNHDEVGRFSESDSAAGTAHHVEKATKHSAIAKDHAEKALKTTSPAIAEHHASHAEEHHAHAKNHAEHAAHAAHGPGEQIHAHVAGEHVNLTEALVDQAREYADSLKEGAEEEEV